MKRNYFTYMLQAVVLLCTSLVISSCDDIFASEDNPIASYLSMSDKDVTIKIGDTYKRTAIAVSGAVIEYSSSDETVATVDNEGTVTGKSVGDATITATATGYNTSGKKIYLAESKTYNVKVDPILAQSVTINNPLSTIIFTNPATSAATLTATVTPANATDKSVTWTSDKPAVATVDPNTGEITGIAAGSAKITATANDASGKTATFTVIVGLLPGIFTVDNGTPAKKVQFAQGNLQATTADLSVNWSWNFAANQWSYIGDETANNKVNGNGTVSENGTVDLFGWVGESSTTLTSGAALYGISKLGDGASYGINSNTDNLKSDWGNIFDVSGTSWRTLTKDEWVYVLKTRNASTIGTTDNARFAKAYLFGTTHGIIIFPDNYTHPTGVADPTGINQTDGTSWNANTYNATDWAKMEAEGCVFLPAAGERNGSGVGSVNDAGRYWSSTYSSWNYSCVTNFDSNEVNPEGGQMSRSTGCSVRLVYPAQ